VRFTHCPGQGDRHFQPLLAIASLRLSSEWGGGVWLGVLGRLGSGSGLWRRWAGSAA
jgi:hypothetical protein